MVKRHTKGADGKYHINGKKFDQLVGSRAQVFHGTAYKTTSSAVKPKGDALTRKDLKMNKHGRIVSSAKSKKGPMMLKRLHNKGYFTRKGHFGAVKKSAKGRRSRRHPHKGQASRTRKGRKDFVTHKGDKYYNRRRHRQRGKHGRRPYTKKHRRRSGVRRVTIHEKRSRRTGRFVRGGVLINSQGGGGQKIDHTKH